MDIGVTYYVTNIIGYMSIYLGINELGKTNQKLLKIRPYIIIMIAHSLIFFLLNITDNSPLKVALSSTPEVIIALVGFVFIIAGMFLVFVIISLILDNLISKVNKELLYNLVNMMMLLFILSGISTYFQNYIPMLATVIMGALLVMEVLFLISYYYVFRSDEKYT
ncbi:hypothetical protein NSQ62_08910 [Solibacillus sp. FSL H8-0523]|uniref:hypothetical protein n=1 Tax=Solibacillus sp. FSL H8-0523 TaxID=2954511 RepID=UPI0031017380